MADHAAFADEAPLTARTFPLWALFTLVFVAATLAAAALLAAVSLVSRRDEQERPAAKPFRVLAAARP